MQRWVGSDTPVELVKRWSCDMSCDSQGLVPDVSRVLQRVSKNTNAEEEGKRAPSFSNVLPCLLYYIHILSQLLYVMNPMKFRACQVPISTWSIFACAKPCLISSLLHSGTPLVWTPWGPERSVLISGKHIWDIAKCPE